MKYFLIGYMGCGKSTLSRKIAQRTGWRVIDTDAEVERIEGASIADIFHYEGEDHFREMERQVIERIASTDESLIVATGGGLPVWRDNMARMAAVGRTVYLRRSAANIASRLSPHGRAKRPKLRGLNDEELLAYMQRSIAEREPHYAQAMQIIDCDTLSDEVIIQIIINQIDCHE
jgi:shikimate kinase